MSSEPKALQKIQPASSPFNKPSADVILRTSDEVDFHAHKIVLSLASSFFETMFSIPQPASSDPTERPVVKMVEDSKTLDCLLRYCYPVQDPFAPSLELLDSVLESAKKYDFTETIDLVTGKLCGFLFTNALSLFAIGCRHRNEDLAIRAAAAWRTTKSPKKGSGLFGGSVTIDDEALLANWRTSWQSAKFSHTLISQSYTSIMKGRISAASFFRLLKYLRDGHSTTFSHPTPGPASNATPPVPTSVDEIEQLAKDHPFDRPDADLILQSHDGVSFRVHRALLEMNMDPGVSNRTLDSAFEGSVESAKDSSGLPVIKVKDDSRTLGLLLRLSYPPRQRDTIPDWNLDKLGSETSLRVYEAAQRYGFSSIPRAYWTRMNQLLSDEPLRVYCIAVALGCANEAQLAARQLAFSNLRDMYCTEMESLPVANYYRLLEFHHSCQATIRSVWKKHFSPNDTESHAKIFGLGSMKTVPSSPSGQPASNSSNAAIFPVGNFGSADPPISHETNPSAMSFEWLDAPGVNSVHHGIWTALLEREVTTATKTRASNLGGHNIGWKAIAQTKEKVESAIQQALQSLIFEA